MNLESTSCLFNLPIELRLKIYEYAFTTEHGIILRSLDDLALRNRVMSSSIKETTIKLSDNSLLTSCKRVYNEALPTFYKQNTFHYSVSIAWFAETFAETQDVLHHFTQHLPLMQHVSIGNIDYGGCWQNDADKLIAARIEMVHLDCPRLRTFCLQLQAPYENPDPYNVLSNDSRALSELRLISQRLDETPGLEHLEIVWTSRKEHGSNAEEITILQAIRGARTTQITGGEGIHSPFQLAG